MKLKNYKLYHDDGAQYKFVKSPNISRGYLQRPAHLVYHFTAGRSLNSTVNWLTNKKAKASAHVVIGKDGTIVQLAPFNRPAWHAGRSEWKNQKGLNRYSIGIEIDNAGELERAADGSWHTWFGRKVDDENVIIKAHKYGGPETGWERYTEEQIDACIELGTLLYHQYDLVDIIGHEDIAPGRKRDPGPAFPMQSVISDILGRDDEEDCNYNEKHDLDDVFICPKL